MASFGHVAAAFLHHNFTAKGKEQFSDALKQVLKEHPDIPIICWGKVAKGGQQGKDYSYGLEWDAKAGSNPVLKCLQMIKSGQIGGAGRKSNDTMSPRGSVDLQPQMIGQPLNVRRSIDMNSNSFSERRVSFSSPRQSVEMVPPPMMMPHQGMAPQVMVPSVRRSMDMQPYSGSPLHSSSQVASPLLSHPQLEVQPSAGSQSHVIKALADEVQRLRLLVEEKRARERAAGETSTSSGIMNGMTFS
jgi:hypothetical protein